MRNHWTDLLRHRASALEADGCRRHSAAISFRRKGNKRCYRLAPKGCAEPPQQAAQHVLPSSETGGQHQTVYSDDNRYKAEHELSLCFSQVVVCVRRHCLNFWK